MCGGRPRRHAIKVQRKQGLVPEVLDVVCGHGRIGYPIVDDSIDGYCYRVSREDLAVKERKEIDIRRQTDRQKDKLTDSPPEAAHRSSRYEGPPFFWFFKAEH